MPDFRVHWNILRLPNEGPKLSKYWGDVIDLDDFLLWDFLLSRDSSLAQHPMQHARIYRAWL